jgi:WG containing repeat
MKVLVFVFTIFSFSMACADSYQTFSDNGKIGIKNDQGQVVVPPSFEALGWSDGSFSVIGNVTGYRVNNQWGILNLKNEFITQANYESLVYAGADNIVARKRVNPIRIKTGCINLQGEIKIPFQYEGITIYGLRAVVFNLESAKYVYGLIDLENHILIPVQYKNIYPLGTLRYAVENETGKIALHGEDGKPITDFQIDSISQFRDSKAIVYEN